MSYKISSIIVEDFYDNPDEVREYALKCNWERPIGASVDNNWYSTSQNQAYITNENISKLENIIGIDIDKKHFKSNYADGGCGWNAVFHVKMSGSDFCQNGIHNHVTDGLNSPKLSINNLGYSAIVNLTPNNLAFDNGGQDIWKSEMGIEWYNSEELVNDSWPMVGFCREGANKPAPVEINHHKFGKWKLLSRVQYRYNTAVIMPSDVWHAGSDGWGDSIENGRMIQTFFFREKKQFIKPTISK